MDIGTYENGYEYVKLREDLDEKILVIPGLNDEMMRTTDYPLMLKYHFRGLHDYQVIVASRKRGLDEDISTEDLAEAYSDIVDEEGEVHVLGISMGGMIAQHLVRKNSKVDKLVLGFSAEKLGSGGKKKIQRWVDMLERDQSGRFYSRVIQDTFTGLSKPFFRVTASFFGPKVSKPPVEDLIACSKACLNHDATSTVSEIENETMVLGAEKDVIFPPELIDSTASKIGAEATFIPGNHSAFYQKHSLFHDKVRKFLKTR